MNRRRIEELVEEALEQLPRPLREGIHNLIVRVENNPTREQLRRWNIPHGTTLFGFYEGIPLTERTSGYGLVAPDVIYIFQKPIQSVCSNEREIREEIRRTVWHEIAHHFGIDDERLEELGMG